MLYIYTIVGHSCYRRYAPNYPKPGEIAPPPIDPESAPKPQRKCLRSANGEFAFHKFIFYY
jgi:hypothetical protein